MFCRGPIFDGSLQGVHPSNSSSSAGVSLEAPENLTSTKAHRQQLDASQQKPRQADLKKRKKIQASTPKERKERKLPRPLLNSASDSAGPRQKTSVQSTRHRRDPVGTTATGKRQNKQQHVATGIHQRFGFQTRNQTTPADSCKLHCPVAIDLHQILYVLGACAKTRLWPF